jgi:hypothetical protein
METRDEIGVLLLLYNLLELESKPTNKRLNLVITHGLHETITRERSRPYQPRQHPTKDVKWCESSHFQILTLIIMTSVDWKRAGLTAGSKTDALDWND